MAAGLDVAQTCALSLLLFSGGSQFAVVGIAGAGGGAPAAVTTAALLGARNGLYGLQMSPVLAVRGMRRWLAAQLTIDESTAVGSAQLVQHPGRPELARLGFWATGAAVFVLWNAMTLAGALVGDALGDPRRFGLDAAAAAAFLALLWPRLRVAGTLRVAAAAAVVAIAAVPFTPAGVPVLAAAVAALALGLATRPRSDASDPPGTSHPPGTSNPAGTSHAAHACDPPGTSHPPGAGTSRGARWRVARELPASGVDDGEGDA